VALPLVQRAAEKAPQAQRVVQSGYEASRIAASRGLWDAAIISSKARDGRVFYDIDYAKAARALRATHIHNRYGRAR